MCKIIGTSCLVIPNDSGLNAGLFCSCPSIVTIYKGRGKVLASMVEPIANLPREKMKVFAGHSAERIEPILRIVPEALDPVVERADRKLRRQDRQGFSLPPTLRER